ncbi:magnesium transporter CorA family protein [Candidatus Bathyarchaeota archaeon]|nr:magnesium transporter CorA family protein [Candidatus Bathyarchaeota archaeon]
MIRLVQLGSNSESIISTKELPCQELSNVWIELVDPSEDELHAVADCTQIPISFLRLPEDRQIDLRLEPGYGVINFIVMQDVTSTKDTYPVNLAFSKDFLISVAPKEVQYIVNLAKERMSRTKIDPPAHVVYFIVDEIASSHFGHLENIETVTSDIEEEIIEKPNPQILKKILSLKSNLISFNKNLWYERGLVFNLRKYESVMPKKIRDLFDTTHEDLTRQIDIAETYREILSDAINVHLSATSNKINVSINSLTIVIFYLTIITTVTSFPNMVATFFGIGQFGSTHYAIIIAAILASTILPFVWLWRKKWLSARTALRQIDEEQT